MARRVNEAGQKEEGERKNKKRRLESVPGRAGGTNERRGALKCTQKLSNRRR